MNNLTRVVAFAPLTFSPVKAAHDLADDQKNPKLAIWRSEENHNPGERLVAEPPMAVLPEIIAAQYLLASRIGHVHS